MQNSVVQCSDQIRVPNKYGLQVSLAEETNYAFMRMHIRLVRALGMPGLGGGPPTASDFEPTFTIEQALGDHLNCLTYIAKNRLGYDIEDIARYNIYKLTHRKLFGKSAGHLFS